jgi:ribosomal protein S15P/S13E
LEFGSLAFIEAVLKAYRMSDAGVTTPRGKIITSEQGRPIRLEAGEGVAQAAGFRPERLARISGEHWTMENVQKHFKEKRDDLYSRYRLAKTSEDKKKIIRDMQRFNLDSRKYRGVIPPITVMSMGRRFSRRRKNRLLDSGESWKLSHKIEYKGIA